MTLFTSTRTLSAVSPALPQHLGQPALVPVRLTGQEGLNSLFTYTLELKTPEALAFAPSLAANFNLSDMVGRDLTVRIQLDGKGQFIPGAIGASGLANIGAGVREISALISEAKYLREEGRHSVYALTLRPWLWLATLTTDCKIFQDKTVIELLDVPLADHPFPVPNRLAPGNYPVRDYQVQYNESDYDFFARLCEEWGIAWWFEHSEGKHRLVLADQPGAYRANPSPAYQEVSWYPPGHNSDEEYPVTPAVADRLTSGVWASTDTDYTRTRADLSVLRHDPRPTGHADQEVFAWPVDSAQPKAGAGGISGAGNDPLAEGEHFAKVRLEALRAPGHVAIGHGALRGMVPGCSFNLRLHPQDAANIEWLILETTLAIEEVGEESQGPGITALGDLQPGQQWRCSVDLVLQPTSEPYRPAQTRQKPVAQGIQRATVTGPEGKEMWTDAYGRVKVAFPWDRYHQNDEKSSCWLRVSSPWAGTQFGGIQIPRIGQEVIVDFESGDPDRPIITGRVVNNQNLPPWNLPENQSLSGFRSKELYGNQHNHLILDDAEGEVQAQLSSDHALSQLNLGKVTRVPDESGRQDKRGEGFELRTDAHGVIRAKDGLLLTTEGRSNAASYIKSMGETISRLEAAQQTHATLADLAMQHQAQEIDQQERIAKTLEGQNKGIQGQGQPDAKAGNFPEFAEPHLTLASPAGIETTTAGSTHIASDQHFAITTGESVGIAAGKGLFASVRNGVRLFVHKAGMRMVLGKNDISMQALQNSVRFTAALEINERANRIELKATKEVRINGGGSGTTWNASGITEFTAGQHVVHAATKNFDGPKSLPIEVPPSICVECMLKANQQASALTARS